MSAPIIQSVVALMLLTMLVWIYIYVRRINYIGRHRIDPDSINSPEALNTALPDQVNAPSNNLKNLFELPVIFYVVCIFLLAAEADATVGRLPLALTVKFSSG